MEKDDVNKDELAAMIKNGFDEMGRRFDVIENDVGVLKQDVGMLKNQLASEVSSVRTEIGSLRSETREGFMKTNDKVDLLTEKLVDKNVITNGPLPTN